MKKIILVVILVVIVLGGIFYWRMSSQELTESTLDTALIEALNDPEVQRQFVTARTEASDSIIKLNVQTLKQEIEVGKVTTNYSTLKANNTDVLQGAGILSGSTIMQNILASSNSQGSIQYVITNAGPTAYAIYGRLVSDPTTFVCLDSTSDITASGGGFDLKLTKNNTSLTCK